MTWAIDEKSYSQRRACALVGLHPRTYRYASTRPDDSACGPSCESWHHNAGGSATGVGCLPALPRKSG